MKVLSKIRTILGRSTATLPTRENPAAYGGGEYHDPIDLEESLHADEDEQLFDFDQIEDAQEPTLADAEQPMGEADDDTERLAVVLTVMAEEGDHFEGSDLLREFNAVGLEYDKSGIYHAYPMEGERSPLFSVGNVLKPGTFNQQQVMNLRTTGIILFFKLPGAHSGKLSFEKMTETAHKLSVDLGGKVCDESRRALTPHSLQRLRDLVYEFEYNHELESRRATLSQSQQR